MTDSPKHNFISPHVDSADMDQIALFLEQHNKREQEKKAKAKNRVATQFQFKSPGLGKTAASTNTSAAKTTANESAPTVIDSDAPAKCTESQRIHGDESRSAVSDCTALSQLNWSSFASTSLPSIESSYRLPKVKPIPPPMKFDPPTFAFGSSQTTASKKRGRDSGDGEGSESIGYGAAFASALKTEGLSQGLLRHSLYNSDSDDPHLFSLLDQVNDVSDTKLGGKKRNPFKAESMSDTNQNYTCGLGMSTFHPPASLQNKWTREEVEDMVAFADKWIPDPKPKKRRTGEKE